MGNRASRRRRTESGRAVPLMADVDKGSFGCGCTHLGRMLFDVLCSACGNRNREEVVVPTSAVVGEARDMSLSCSQCGAEAVGTARIVEVLPAH